MQLPATSTKTWFLSILAFLPATICFLPGCSSTKIITEYDCADAANINKDTTVWHYCWGLIQSKDIRPQCDKRYNHLNKVVVKSTPAHVLLTVITLGIVIPQKVSWCCAPPNPQPGHLGN
ncbi:hypothetical protein A4H97_19165 [Niastella yeongjuensis]|uniref:Uncharacterized protein n=1 Tax=Niastella yeongjuensis TaxID=354355 RepID=A0A1V9DYT7_9BACT|nr:hypothetical protein [Niastella yeongjuensis]OQP38835.1 hypothetical protein A4H97_19165 [Niastella yeongjuensis]SEO30754.1 hypothetical protein SAMN05660816_02568 [Niastella yeongjuensis]